MHVILSVPVPSDIVISPFAIPWSIISSIMNDVSPGGFDFLSGSDDCLLGFNALLPYDFVFFIVCVFLSTLGPFSRLVLTNLAACSFVKQSQMPSHATTMKSCSGLIWTFLISGKEDTWCFLLSSIFRYGAVYGKFESAFFAAPFFAFFSNYSKRAGFLYSQSPMALETAMIPWTLPSSTKPPAALILYISPASSGLWSWLSSVTLPCLLTRIALESPEFAQYNVSCAMRITQAVHPALNGIALTSLFSYSSNFAFGPLNAFFIVRRISCIIFWPSSLNKSQSISTNVSYKANS